MSRNAHLCIFNSKLIVKLLDKVTLPCPSRVNLQPDSGQGVSPSFTAWPQRMQFCVVDSKSPWLP